MQRACPLPAPSRAAADPAHTAGHPAALHCPACRGLHGRKLSSSSSSRSDLLFFGEEAQAAGGGGGAAEDVWLGLDAGGPGQGNACATIRCPSVSTPSS